MGEKDFWIENMTKIICSEDNEFLWMIPQAFLFRIGQNVISPCFRFDKEDWYLGMIPSLVTEGYETDIWINLFLWTKGQNELKQRYNVQVDIETFQGPNLCSHTGEGYVTYDTYRKKQFCHHNGETDVYYGFVGRIMLKYGDYSKVKDSGRVKIICKIKRIDDCPENISICSSTEDGENENQSACVGQRSERLNQSELKGADRLIHNLSNLLQNEWGSDVILKNTDHEFRAHMTILGARSPVFASMFQHDMIEKKTGSVDISDCSTNGFKVFLQFLYTGNADTMSTTNVFDLYYIADKYQVDDLKAECAEFMENNLSVDTFCDVIALSLRHFESDLQKAATRFFCKNIKGIVKTVQWQKYMAENPTHANELIIKAVNA